MRVLALDYLGFGIWLLLYPVLWLAVTPGILVTALFQRGGYAESVSRNYAAVTRFWGHWGAAIV